MANSFSMAGSAILIEEPIKGVIKEVNIATINAGFLREALVKEGLFVMASAVACLALVRLTSSFPRGSKIKKPTYTPEAGKGQGERRGNMLPL